MNRKINTTIITILLWSLQGVAQSTPCYFNTVGVKVHRAEAVEAPESSNQTEPTEGDDYSRLSVEQLEQLIEKYESRLLSKNNAEAEDSSSSKSYVSTKASKNKQLTSNGASITKSRVHSYQDWTPRELNLENLREVVGEVGLSNTLFVLAQAVLETGNFSSRVCKENNNLFGLYDSKHKEYFRFARWEDSVVGYGRMIQHRYKGGNYLSFLKRIGYAEDPRYISKVAQLAKNLYHRFFAQ